MPEKFVNELDKEDATPIGRLVLRGETIALAQRGRCLAAHLGVNAKAHPNGEFIYRNVSPGAVCLGTILNTARGAFYVDPTRTTQVALPAGVWSFGRALNREEPTANDVNFISRSREGIYDPLLAVTRQVHFTVAVAPSPHRKQYQDVSITTGITLGGLWLIRPDAADGLLERMKKYGNPRGFPEVTWSDALRAQPLNDDLPRALSFTAMLRAVERPQFITSGEGETAEKFAPPGHISN